MKFKQWIKIRESLGVGPFLGKCADTKDYQVLGACSDQKNNKLLKNRPKIKSFSEKK